MRIHRPSLTFVSLCSIAAFSFLSAGCQPTEDVSSGTARTASAEESASPVEEPAANEPATEAPAAEEPAAAPAQANDAAAASTAMPKIPLGLPELKIPAD